jgi:mannose/fructose/N-acetylgalactosamine-specific phosphotransferase system component IIC
MSKKKKDQGFSTNRIFLLIGAIGAAIGAAVLALLYFSAGDSKNKDEPEETEEPEEQVKPD